MKRVVFERVIVIIYPSRFERVWRRIQKDFLI